MKAMSRPAQFLLVEKELLIGLRVNQIRELHEYRFPGTTNIRVFFGGYKAYI